MSGLSYAISNYSQIATEVADILEQLSAELRVTNNPHVVARRSLGGIDRYGWTKVPYSAEAFRTWKALHERSPEDIETIHHLAIMHHARAFDVETSNSPQKADADWKSALQYWHELWHNDAFWDQLAQSLTGQTNAVKIVSEIRDSWPVELLKIHFDIAIDPDTKNRGRIAFHVRLALDSPFPDEAKDQVRQKAYEQWVSSLDPQVWQTDFRVPDVIEVATARIREYLERDPECPYALADVLRLQERLLWARYDEINSLSQDDPKRDQRIHQVCESASKWGPYFERLGSDVETLDSDLRHRLGFWYFAVGQVYVADGRLREAGAYFERAVMAYEDPESRQRAQDMLGETLALEARNVAGAGSERDRTRARWLADEVRGRDGLSIRAHRFLANAYLLLDEFDTAEHLCRTALSVELDTSDFSLLETAEQEKSLIRDLLERVAAGRHRHQVTSLLDQGRGHMDARRYADALQVFSQAVNLEPDAVVVYVLRSQSYLAMRDWRSARADVECCNRLFTKHSRPSAEMTKAIRDIMGQCDILRRLEEDYGGPDAAALQQEAVRMYNTGRLNEAIELFRRAIEVSRESSRLKEELSRLLCEVAVSQVNAVRRPSSEVISDAESMLREAISLDSRNTQANTNLQRLREMSAAITKAETMEREYGGLDALELQQRAVAAFNNGNYEEAIEHLREAIRLSHNSYKLEKELSQVLTAAAVTMVNALTQGRNMSGLQGFRMQNFLGPPKEMLEEAVNLDSTNVQARTNLTLLKRLLNDWS